MPNSDNYATAVATLQTAKTVSEWNEIRATVKATLTPVEFNKIDYSGLIVKVLGKDV